MRAHCMLITRPHPACEACEMAALAAFATQDHLKPSLLAKLLASTLQVNVAGTLAALAT